MSANSTSHFISTYVETAEAPMFLSGLFQSPPANFFNSEEVEYDVIREDDEVAVPVPDVSVDGNENQASRYTNKSFVPPVYIERGTVSVFEAMKRRPGDNPFVDPDFMAYVASALMDLARKLNRKIARAVELQASQVLQTGELALTNAAGATVYSLDYQPASTHLVTVTTDWATDGSTGDPLTDLASLATVVNTDGKKRPDQLICGPSALTRLLANDLVVARLDNRRMDLGQIQAPTPRGGGAMFHGYLSVSSFRFEIWSYDATYVAPSTGTATTYMTTDKIIMRSSTGRLDLCFGGIPRIANTNLLTGIMPTRITSPELGLDLNLAAWIDPAGKTIHLEVGARPLAVPTAIDTLACLDVAA